MQPRIIVETIYTGPPFFGPLTKSETDMRETIRRVLLDSICETLARERVQASAAGEV